MSMGGIVELESVGLCLWLYRLEMSEVLLKKRAVNDITFSVPFYCYFSIKLMLRIWLDILICM